MTMTMKSRRGGWQGEGGENEIKLGRVGEDDVDEDVRTRVTRTMGPMSPTKIKRCRGFSDA